MGKYIIFKTDSASARGWEERSLSHTEALTDILAEHYDSSDAPLPEPGYRLREYHRIEKFASEQFPSASTHSRIGDWKVIRTESYIPEIPGGNFETIAICYCQYSPVTTPLKPLADIQNSEAIAGEEAIA